MARVEILEVVAFEILHCQVEPPVGLPVFEVADDAFVVADLGEDLASPNEPAAREPVEPQPLVHQTEGAGFALGVGREPNIGHPPAVDQLLQVKATEGARFNPRARF